jgi:hypothetical protein
VASHFRSQLDRPPRPPPVAQLRTPELVSRPRFRTFHGHQNTDSTEKFLESVINAQAKAPL